MYDPADPVSPEPVFVFVILHYRAVEDTCACLDSLTRSLVSIPFRMVVVDNASGDGSADLLQERYAGRDDVRILRNSRNLGFARGNNVGYRYAKEVLRADFIILTNNDTVFEQADFLEIVHGTYRRTRFSVLGPNIISLKNREPQNPHARGRVTLSQAVLLKAFLRMLLVLNALRADLPFYLLFASGNILTDRKKLALRELSGVMLHGACLIFSPGYVRAFDGLYDRTFLFMEEVILHVIAMEEGLTTLYSPELVVYHKEDSSTDSLFRKNHDKRRFLYRHQLESTRELILLLRRYAKRHHDRQEGSRPDQA